MTWSCWVAEDILEATRILRLLLIHVFVPVISIRAIGAVLREFLVVPSIRIMDILIRASLCSKTAV